MIICFYLLFVTLLFVKWGGVHATPESSFHQLHRRVLGSSVSCLAETEILIVGAGLSGLAAARYLHDAGCRRLTLIESRDVIGGRIRTNHTFGVEVGAGWIHGTNAGNPTYATAVRFNISTKFVGGDSGYIGGMHRIALYGPEGIPLTDRQRLRSFELMETLWWWLSQSDLSVESDRLCDHLAHAMARMNISAFDRTMIYWHFEVLFGGDAAADPCDLSFASFASYQQMFSGGDSIFPQGYDAIPEALAATEPPLDIRLGERVTRILHDDDGVYIHTSKGNLYHGHYAIITLPVGILQLSLPHIGSVSFEPALPHWKRETIHALHMGTLNRIALKFDAVYWPREQYTFGYISQVRGEFPMIINQVPVTGRPILEFMIGGQAALSLELLSNEETVMAAMKVVRRLFGEQVPWPVDVLVSRWSQDPESYGAYAHVPPDRDAKRDAHRLGRPIGKRLLFAGEATHVTHTGMSHGALESGKREAKRILMWEREQTCDRNK